MTKAKCLHCGYVFYKEVEEGKDFMYVNGKPYCFECLQKAVDLVDTVNGSVNGVIAVVEES